MPLLSGQILEVTFGGNALGQRIYNIRHWRPTSWNQSDPSAELPVIAGTIRSRWVSAILPFLPTQYVIPFFLLRTINSWTTGPGNKQRLVYSEFYELRPFPIDAGVKVGEVLPPHCAQAVILRTGQSGKRKRGAMRLGPIREIDSLDGIQQDVSGLAAAITAFFADITMGGAGILKACVFSKTQFFGTSPPPVPDTASTLITQTLTPLPIKSQVSRKQPTVTLG